MGRRFGGVRFILIVRAAEIEIQDYRRNATEKRTFSMDRIRWFGRPEKYATSDNETRLHFETDAGWQVVRLWLTKSQTMELIRALKQITSDELITAYRRRRPYVHVEPTQAFPASQDIHGAWTLAPPIQLYVMPRCIVILNGQTVLRTIALEEVQDIGAVRRLDASSGGLVRFRAENETFAFAVEYYDIFAQSLAEAAKRTLEMPIERKSKSKYEDEIE